ncbi:hypothetical protein NDU88_004632 [Pleurodeles waltl]|uniref:Uncharacterized protein n=1 Tax=Pleurodeles waltl TaxID=8319 RepID=A0AAV7M6U7_PLEWA|nr:hypothetical protein NDU88_004632 [Pleurodeles waltl]
MRPEEASRIPFRGGRTGSSGRGSTGGIGPFGDGLEGQRHGLPGWMLPLVALEKERAYCRKITETLRCLHRQECCVYIPDNSGNVRMAIGKIEEVEEGARKVADVTEIGGILNDIAAWFRGWGSWLTEVLVVGIRVCPSCLTMLMKKMCHKDTEHHRKRRHEDEAREDDATEMTPVHQDN